METNFIPMIELFLRVLDFAIPILFMIALGLFGAGVLVEMGLTQGLSRLAKPIFRFTRLPEACASAFVISLGSAVAANSMVAKFRDDGCLKDREVALCAILNSIPVYVRELFTYQIPIVIPALGLAVGGFYALVFIATALFKITVVVILSRVLLDANICQVPAGPPPEKISFRDALLKAVKKGRRLFFKIATIYLFMTTLVFALKDRGAFEVFNVLPLADSFGIPPESIVPLTTYVASPIAGISLLGPMIHSGEITAIQSMIVLMLGSMFMLPFFAMRSLLPRYIAIFGPHLGPKIVVFSTGMSIMVRFFILVVLLKVA